MSKSPSGTDPSILKRVAEEIRKKMDLEASLGVAKRRQRVMLPPPPSIDGYEFDSAYYPAAEISGDFYDFVELGPGRVAVLIGDVSGHGVEAAIVMGMAKKALSIFARSASGPKEALVVGNDDLCGDLDSETYLTAICAFLDAPAGRMVLARAGHPLPVLVNPKRKVPHELLKSPGMMLGMNPGQIFANSVEELAVDLVAGDTVFLYTDGLVEARNRSLEQYGLDRLLDVLDRHAKDRPSKLLQAVRESLDEFRSGAEPEDDITMIAFRRVR